MADIHNIEVPAPVLADIPNDETIAPQQTAFEELVMPNDNLLVPDLIEDVDENVDKEVPQVAQATPVVFEVPLKQQEDDEQQDDEEADDEITLSPFTQAYVNALVKPYIDALSQADAKEGILQWLPLIFEGEYLEDTLVAVNKAEDIETARNSVINIMIESLVDEAQETAGEIVTPWDIAAARDPQLVKLFGPANKQIPIQVAVGPNVYNHTLSQDFVFGILNVLNGNKQFNITLNGSQIPLEELQMNYTAPKDTEGVAYKATLPQGPAFFNSPDVIQGIMTASQWIRADPHTLVKELNGFIDGQWVPLNF